MLHRLLSSILYCLYKAIVMPQAPPSQLILRSLLYTTEQDEVRMGHGDDALLWAKEKPQFNVKAKGLTGFVGNAWLRQSRFGRYLHLYLRTDLPRGSVLFVSPRRGQEALLAP